jgi:hypothetical protein
MLIIQSSVLLLVSSCNSVKYGHGTWKYFALNLSKVNWQRKRVVEDSGFRPLILSCHSYTSILFLPATGTFFFVEPLFCACCRGHSPFVLPAAATHGISTPRMSCHWSMAIRGSSTMFVINSIEKYLCPRKYIRCSSISCMLKSTWCTGWCIPEASNRVPRAGHWDLNGGLVT